MYDNAENSRNRTENARKRQNYNDFILSIRLEIINNADAGIYKTIYKVSKHNLEFIDTVIEYLLDDGYDINFNTEKNILSIQWF